ncbi:hypothetical protein GS634_21875 [Ruegeria atlantica]|uniref:Coiled coil domain-containing protein n=1 Tax=Ruegeria atlantica TaxID=81569 RepID=A0AA91BVQ1_9RHOB|nr:hypothetical protein [Ruegeria atlantica]NOE20788.1 hypothetical protein [Ruegeria atlantica]
MTRVGYEKKAKLQIDTWNAQIDHLEAQLKTANDDSKRALQAHHIALCAARAEAEAKLEELKTTDEEAWDDIRGGYEAAWDDMQNALSKAASKLT